MRNQEFSGYLKRLQSLTKKQREAMCQALQVCDEGLMVQLVETVGRPAQCPHARQR